jgi:hypothetical protein
MPLFQHFQPRFEQIFKSKDERVGDIASFLLVLTDVRP